MASSRITEARAVRPPGPLVGYWKGLFMAEQAMLREADRGRAGSSWFRAVARAARPLLDSVDVYNQMREFVRQPLEPSIEEPTLTEVRRPARASDRRSLSGPVRPGASFALRTTTEMSREIMRHMQPRTSASSGVDRSTVPIQVYGNLGEVKDHDEKVCGVCYAEFRTVDLVARLSCCRSKVVHAECLRRCEGAGPGLSRCPFCRSAQIALRSPDVAR